MASPHANGIKPERLRWRIVIQQPVYTEKLSGAREVTGWTEFADRRAEYVPQSMTEAFEAARTVATRRAAFVIRWLPGLTETMRILFNDGNGERAWDIQGFDQIGYREGWRIIAEAVN